MKKIVQEIPREYFLTKRYFKKMAKYGGGAITTKVLRIRQNTFFEILFFYL